MLNAVARRMCRLFLCLLVPLVLAACGQKTGWATDDAVRNAVYRSGNQPSVTLFTVIGATSQSGGHSALMIDGSQRVIYDPAGSWHHPWVPARYDVDYGITDKMYKFYIDYHSRKTWYVREQRVPVTLAQADALIAEVQRRKPTSQMFCASSVASVLRTVPEFQSIPQTMFPMTLSAAFGKLPGVVTDDHYDDDPDDNSGVLMREVDRASQVKR